jgi:DNA-binding LytR/AlgR family response regulator
MKFFYVESLDNYVKVHVKDQVLITRENISTLEEKLSKPSFREDSSILHC